MKNSGKLTCLLLLSISIAGISQTTIQNTAYPAGTNQTVSGPSTITAHTNVTVSSGAVVKFKATGGITLGPGFTASAGSSFRAYLFIDNDGDGMDNAWETTHGLNPNSAADAMGDPDGDGIPNVVEYRLGTNPLQAASADSGGSPVTQLKVHRPNP